MFFLTTCYCATTVTDANIKNCIKIAQSNIFLARSCHWTSPALQSCDIAGSWFGLSGVAKVDLTRHLSLARPPLLLGLVVLSAPASLMACHFLPFSIILSLPPPLSPLTRPRTSPTHTRPTVPPSLPPFPSPSLIVCGSPGGRSLRLQLRNRSSSHIPAFKWNKQDGWLLTEGHQPPGRGGRARRRGHAHVRALVFPLEPPL